MDQYLKSWITASLTLRWAVLWNGGSSTATDAISRSLVAKNAVEMKLLRHGIIELEPERTFAMDIVRTPAFGYGAHIAEESYNMTNKSSPYVKARDAACLRRLKVIVRMREVSALSFGEIARTLQFSPCRASQLYYMAKRRGL